jgi:hypothetical protein
MPVEATKALTSGNICTLVFKMEDGKATLYTAYSQPPTDADKAEVQVMVDSVMKGVRLGQI